MLPVRSEMFIPSYSCAVSHSAVVEADRVSATSEVDSVLAPLTADRDFVFLTLWLLLQNLS